MKCEVEGSRPHVEVTWDLNGNDIKQVSAPVTNEQTYWKHTSENRPPGDWLASNEGGATYPLLAYQCHLPSSSRYPFGCDRLMALFICIIERVAH